MSAPEGWYADPQAPAPGAERWWNGYHWTAHTRQAPAPPAPSRPPVALGPRPGLRTADGTPFSPVDARIMAWLVDFVLVAIVSFALGRALSLGLHLADVPLTSLPDGWGSGFLPWARDVVLLLVWVVYQAVFLRTAGATFGKQLFRIVVRPVEGSGRLSWGSIARRLSVAGAVAAAGVLPAVGALIGLVALADVLAMATDPGRRSLHDRFGRTLVVRRA